ncbi:uncharacterized protein BDW47DRAFT_111053 [Aspergillus candidus]|uniref:Uncharacterized protein n=1 Tax=Aspergillus candidus TaxID=41067 RepID=A0A2I2F364_ASPCN|nr:hypothetical protein BDW47DRAFT_111053 [Aspergillus candidus]PLB35028.1 hypothetical protein BDW47DRAFT_111053 [Aspergillus candidus]
MPQRRGCDWPCVAQLDSSFEWIYHRWTFRPTIYVQRRYRCRPRQFCRRERVSSEDTRHVLPLFSVVMCGSRYIRWWLVLSDRTESQV